LVRMCRTRLCQLLSTLSAWLSSSNPIVMGSGMHPQRARVQKADRFRSAPETAAPPPNPNHRTGRFVAPGQARYPRGSPTHEIARDELRNPLVAKSGQVLVRTVSPK
jgi:hypothetical protein